MPCKLSYIKTRLDYRLIGINSLKGLWISKLSDLFNEAYNNIVSPPKWQQQPQSLSILMQHLMPCTMNVKRILLATYSLASHHEHHSGFDHETPPSDHQMAHPTTSIIYHSTSWSIAYVLAPTNERYGIISTSPLFLRFWINWNLAICFYVAAVGFLSFWPIYFLVCRDICLGSIFKYFVVCLAQSSNQFLPTFIPRNSLRSRIGT